MTPETCAHARIRCRLKQGQSFVATFAVLRYRCRSPTARCAGLSLSSASFTLCLTYGTPPSCACPLVGLALTEAKFRTRPRAPVHVLPHHGRAKGVDTALVPAAREPQVDAGACRAGGPSLQREPWSAAKRCVVLPRGRSPRCSRPGSPSCFVYAQRRAIFSSRPPTAVLDGRRCWPVRRGNSPIWSPAPGYAAQAATCADVTCLWALLYSWHYRGIFSLLGLTKYEKKKGLWLWDSTHVKILCE